ncbi:S8 family serine peptidase [Pseudaquabacterium rugosum]|uniref:S8 family serine peptidase n=1 Tax=Pseudaquabacterium rugosum TaxID=2984194 RepID=A0ABU9BI71_9BURK
MSDRVSAPLPSPRRLLILSAIAAAAALCGSVLSPARAAESTTALLTDRLIIKYRSGSAAERSPDSQTMARAHEAVQRGGVQMTRLRATAQAAQVMQLDRAVSAAGARALAASVMSADSDIEYAEPDLVLQHASTTQPNDASYGSQWALWEATAGIRAPAAWASTTGGNTVVAVVDTGYRPHADLVARIVTGHDFISSATIAADGNARDGDALDAGDGVAAGACGSGSAAAASSWHGTHVAGTIAAVADNGSGVAGVAPGARIQPLRVLGQCGGYTSDIADAITWASGGTVSGLSANPTVARVINLSLGGTGSCGTTLQTAITGARSRGALVVVAAGNAATAASSATPANCQGTTVVAAVGRTGARAYYSNYGAPVALAAPGGDMRSGAADGILSTLNTGTTTPGADTLAWYQGTSMATPHVAGTAALMLGRNPALTVEQLDQLLRSSARAFPVACSGCGAGLLDAGAAVAAAAAAAVPVATRVSETTAANDSLATGQTVSGDTLAISGSLSASTDVDHYRISVAAGRTLGARLSPASTLGATVKVYTSAGTLVGSATSSASGAQAYALASHTGTAAATYVVAVSRASGARSGSYALQLRQ